MAKKTPEQRLAEVGKQDRKSIVQNFKTNMKNSKLRRARTTASGANPRRYVPKRRPGDRAYHEGMLAAEAAIYRGDTSKLIYHSYSPTQRKFDTGIQRSVDAFL